MPGFWRMFKVKGTGAGPAVACLLLFSLPCSGRAAEEDGRNLRIMSFNIAAGNGDLARVAAVIREYEPDIVGLQEVDVHWSGRSDYLDQAEELARELGMDAFFAPIYRIPHRDEGRPVREFGLAFLSRHPVRKAADHSLTRLSTQAGDPQLERMGGFPEMIVEVGGQEIRIYNTHLDYRADPRVREMQVGEMLEIIAPLEGPVVVLGDLNARPGQEEIQPLLRKFKDSWSEKGRDAGYTYPAHNPDRRIDYILVSDAIGVVDAEVVETEASDHRPLVVDLLLPGPPPGAAGEGE